MCSWQVRKARRVVELAREELDSQHKSVQAKAARLEAMEAEAAAAQAQAAKCACCTMHAPWSLFLRYIVTATGTRCAGKMLRSRFADH